MTTEEKQRQILEEVPVAFWDFIKEVVAIELRCQSLYSYTDIDKETVNYTRQHVDSFKEAMAEYGKVI